MAEKTIEQKDFDLRLAAAGETARLNYYDLLTQERVKRAKASGGQLVTIDIAEREQLLEKATRIALYGQADPKKMAEDWEKATRSGRPPIGGAQDD